MGFFQNTRKPEGVGGKIMLNMMNVGHSGMAEWGFRHIDVHDGDACLDIGCGGGANVKRLLEKSGRGRVIGLDYSEVSVEKSRKVNQMAIEAGSCEILQGDVMQLPFGNAAFDVITAFETIYFWPDIDKAFAQVYSALKTGGTFMVCNEVSGEKAGDKKWTDIVQGMRLYTPDAIADALTSAGFSGIKIDKSSKNWICLTCTKN